MRAARSQWWSAAVVMWTVPRMGQERTRSPRAKAASTSAGVAAGARTSRACGTAETCWPWMASLPATAWTTSDAAVAGMRPWEMMRAKLTSRGSGAEESRAAAGTLVPSQNSREAGSSMPRMAS